MVIMLVGLPCIIKVTVLLPFKKLVPTPVMVTGKLWPLLALLGVSDIVWENNPKLISINK
jgi:hypothetical protein